MVVIATRSGAARMLSLWFPDKLDPSIKLVKGDVSDADEMRELVHAVQPTRIIHLGALQTPDCDASPVLGMEVNVGGTLNLLNAAADLGDCLERFVFASSAAVYSPRSIYPGETVEEGDRLAPANLCGVWKAAGEQLTLLFHEKTGVPVCGHAVYLPYATVISGNMPAADSSRFPRVAWISGVNRPPESAHWRVVWLLFFSICINYIDRGLLSVSAPVIAAELALSPAELGLLFSAFFWSYAVFQPGAGWLVDRYSVKWIYAGGYLVWSLATAATGFLHRLGPLLGVRLVLGVGESVSYPACSQILARNFPEDRRGRANALIDVGSKIGPGLSMLVGGLLVAQFGWRALFIWVGFGSLLWLLPWILYVPGGEREPPPDDLAAAPTSARSGPSFLDVLRRRELWGTSAGLFSLGYVWYFLLSWLPTYLVNARGFSLERMAVLGSLPFWVMAVGSLCGGWGADRWIARGGSPTRVRKTFVIAGLLGCAGLIGPVATVENSSVSILLVAASCFALGLYTSNVWAITQTLAGPKAAGKWTGIQNALGNMGGVVSPAVTGFIVSDGGSFAPAFAAAAVVAVVGASSYLTLVGDVSPLRWPDENVRAAEV